MARRWGKGPIIALGILGVALSVMILALIPHWAGAAFGFVGVIALAGVTRAAAMVYSQEIVVPHWRPLMSGAINLMAGVSGIAISLGGGYAIAALGYRPFFLISAGTTAVGSLLFWVYFHLLRRDIRAGSPVG